MFSDPQKVKSFTDYSAFLIKKIFKEEKINSGDLNFMFCGDDLIRKYNREFLGHDYETDIITFYYPDEGGKTEGEILISVDTVRSNSVKYKTAYKYELYRVVFHGILHLCGYDDRNRKDKSLMEKKENYYLKLLKEHIKNAGKNN